MKKAAIIIFIFVLLSPTISFADESDVVLGLKWDDSQETVISKIKNKLVNITKENGFSPNTININAEKIISNAEKVRVSFGFKKDKLYFVDFYFNCAAKTEYGAFFFAQRFCEKFFERNIELQGKYKKIKDITGRLVQEKDYISKDTFVHIKYGTDKWENSDPQKKAMCIVMFAKTNDEIDKTFF